MKDNRNQRYWCTTKYEAHDICNLIAKCGISSKHIQAIPAGNDVVIMFVCDDKKYDKVVRFIRKNGISVT